MKHCEECGSNKDLTIGTNPFQPSKNIWLCEKCCFTPFFMLKNVKSSVASTIYLEAGENLKNGTYVHDYV
jgi:hypothetical protein